MTAFLLIFGLAACGTGKDSSKSNGNKKAEIADLIAKEPGTKDEATELHQKLMGAGKRHSFRKQRALGESIPICQ